MPIITPQNPFTETVVYFNEVKQHFYLEDNVNRILPPEFHPIFTTEDENSFKDFFDFFGAKFYKEQKEGSFTKLKYVLDTYNEYLEDKKLQKQNMLAHAANLEAVSSLKSAV